MKMPFNDLKRAVQFERDVLMQRLQRVVESGWYILGEEVRQFEEEFAAYLGVRHAVTVGNGTDAIELALRAVGVRVGDRVITAANAGMYSSTAIRSIGAVPAYADVDESSMNTDTRCLDAAWSPEVSAVVVTHLYGRMADVESIAAWCRSRGLPMIEDCAQSHGAAISAGRAGSFGALACFSFYPTKNLGALGDGGAVVTSDPALDERLRALRQYGWGAKYDVRVTGGGNSRLDEMQAAVLRIRLETLDARNARRRDIANRYHAGLRHPAIAVPALAERGIATDVHYPIPDHLQAAYADPTRAALPVTERLAGQVLTLPCFPELTDAEVDAVIDACNAWNPDA
jgi:dTDP-4-amino-4,6-dideoxygalactose transaminase